MKVTEKQLIEDVLNSRFLEDKYQRKNIIKIYNEYHVGNNKYVDLAVETIDFLYLIEVKVNLSSYDIGQILTYMVNVKPRTFKRIKGALLFYNIAPKELDSINSIINDFNIPIQLIEYNTLKINEKTLNTYNNINNFNKLYDDFKNLEDFDNIDDIKETVETGNIIEPINKSINNLKKSKPLDLENVKKYFLYCKSNLKETNVVPGYKRVGDTLGLTQGESLRIYKALIDKKYLKRYNHSKKTYLISDKIDYQEFI